MVKLASEPNEIGLYCSEEGLALAGVTLLKIEDSEFMPRSEAELRQIFVAAFDGCLSADFDRYHASLKCIATALNQGDLPKAVIGSVLMKLPDIDTRGAGRVRKLDIALKANFNFLEPRNHGEWSREGSGFTSVQIVLPAPSLPIPILGGGAGQRHGTDDDVSEGADSETRDQPKLCPDPSPESTNGRSPEAILYQQQITGLPPGWIVRLNGVNFDGCEPENGNMKEAKFGQDWFFTVPVEDRPKLNEYVETMKQAESQSKAAGNRLVEWYFTNPDAALYWQWQFNQASYHNIITNWESLRTEKRHRLKDSLEFGS
jgi:hypothetical protein